MRTWLVAILVPLFSAALFSQAEWPRPNWEKVEAIDCRSSDEARSSIEKSIGRFKVQIEPVPSPDGDGFRCRADLIAPAGQKTHLMEDVWVSIHQGTGEDLFGDGRLSLVLEGFSGGAHCCYTYRIIDLTNPPVVLPPIENGTPFYFFKDKASGQFRVLTGDGGFDYFDGLCHACVPMPTVVLRLDAEGLHDASPRFVEQYDTEIAAARARIPQGDIGKFEMADFQDAKPVVLEIVLSYLYSGREAEAWQTLEEMWPAGDRDRMKKLILKTRAGGILSRLGKTRP
jgi:hypothetical protein